MFRRRATISRLNADAAYAAPPVGKRGLRYAVWVPFALLVLLGGAILGAGLEIPESELPSSLRDLSGAWTRLTMDASNALTQLWAPPSSRSTPQPRVATAAAVPTPHALNVPVLSTGEDRSIVTYGDRLKITFFETLAVQLDSGDSRSAQSVTEVFPRMDLSGDYPIDESGSVNIPKLGQIAAAGETIAGLQKRLAASFRRAIGRTSNVHVGIAARLPIYVLGSVRNSGSFPYMSGMIVLQALADAGGTGTGTADTSKAIESIRERERLQGAEDNLNQLLIKQAALIAERDNTKDIELPAVLKSRVLSKRHSAERTMLRARLASAVTSLNLHRRRQQAQISLAVRQVNIAQAELDAQQAHANQLKSLLEKKQAMLRDLMTIAARGSVPKYRIIEKNVDISSAAAQLDDIHVAVAQAQRQLAEAEFALEKLRTDYATRLDNEFTTTQHDIDECVRSIATMRAVVQVLQDSIGQVPDGSPRYTSLRITRRVPGGLEEIPATETTSLLPGDILRVAFVKHPDQEMSVDGSTSENNGGG